MSKTTILTDDAERLLRVLRDRCRHRADARTDKELALWLSLNPRAVIDLAGELLEHGRVVVAETKDPPGRWLLADDATDEEIAFAREYVEKLRGRGKSIFVRARNCRRSIDRIEAQRRTESNGQQRLFAEPATAEPEHSPHC